MEKTVLICLIVIIYFEMGKWFYRKTFRRRFLNWMDRQFDKLEE